MFEFKAIFLITLARIFIFYAFTIGALYGFIYKDSAVMIATIGIAGAMFMINSTNKSKEKRSDTKTD